MSLTERGQESGDLHARLSALPADLSEKQRRIAEYLLAEPWKVAFSSAAEVGSRIGVNAATVVRFAQALGYHGFGELQDGVRSRLPRFVTSVEKLREELSDPEAPQNICSTVLGLQIRNIERTAEWVEPEVFNQAVERIASARHVVIGGVGLAGSVVIHFAHVLKKIGIDVREAYGGGIQLALELVGRDERDLFIAIGFLRYVRDTVEALNQAARLRIPTVAITDSVLSPLARKADTTLVVAAAGLQSSSIVATIALTDALVAAVALREPERSMRALERSETIYHQAGLLLD
jgi:DNA-binding MurR/RpiR family transcriptional regulator